MSKFIGRGRSWAVLIVGCLLLLVILAAIKYRQISIAIAMAEAFPERSESVTAVIAEAEMWQRTYKTIGEVKSTQFVELRNEVEGVVSELGFRGGERVERGQVLLQLDDTEDRAQLQAIKAELKLAELQLKRNAELRSQNLVSKNEYDRAEADRNVRLANLASLSATIEKKTLKAPFTADSGLHDLQVGQYLAANSLVTMLSGTADEVWIDFNLPQEQAALPIGEDIRIYARRITEAPMSARVVSADAMIDPISRNRRFRALLKNPTANIRPGAVVTVESNAQKLVEVFRLPIDALRRSNFGTYVYVLSPDDSGDQSSYRAARRKVSPESSESDTVLISSGIEAGELIAATGAFKLEHGMLTNVYKAPDKTTVPAIADGRTESTASQ